MSLAAVRAKCHPDLGGEVTNFTLTSPLTLVIIKVTIVDTFGAGCGRKRPIPDRR